MVCPQCGQPVSADAKICPHCGRVLRVSGLRVRRLQGGGDDLATAKRSALTPTHPRLAQAPSAAVLTDTADPWQSEWMGTAKRPLAATGADARVRRGYLVPGIVAALLLVACGGIALVLHGALFASSKLPAKAPVSATTTSVPTATLSATSTVAPTATTAAYTPPRHAATATPTAAVPTATATAPVVIVTTTVSPEPTVTATGTKAPTPTPTSKPKP